MLNKNSKLNIKNINPQIQDIPWLTQPRINIPQQTRGGMWGSDTQSAFWFGTLTTSWVYTVSWLGFEPKRVDMFAHENNSPNYRAVIWKYSNWKQMCISQYSATDRSNYWYIIAIHYPWTDVLITIATTSDWFTLTPTNWAWKPIAFEYICEW